MTSLDLLPGETPVCSEHVHRKAPADAASEAGCAACIQQQQLPNPRFVLPAHRNLQGLPDSRPVLFAWLICIAKHKEAQLEGLAGVSAQHVLGQTVTCCVQDRGKPF